MEFFRRAAGRPSRLGILAGTFNPITIAHVALAEAAREMVDEVLFVLPQVLPHKTWTGVSFEDRAQLLVKAIEGEDRFSAATTRRGLFVEIAAECREHYGKDVRVSFLCGADAAERIANWDYGEPDAFSRMMGQFDLLVAERGGRFALPHRELALDGDLGRVSATEVRERILRGEAWEELVPKAVRDDVRRLYGR